MERFFKYLISKVELMHFYSGMGVPEWSDTTKCQIVSHLEVLVQHANGTLLTGPYAYHHRLDAWRFVVHHTKGSLLWSEFKGNESLRRDIEMFLTETWTPPTSPERPRKAA